MNNNLAPIVLFVYNRPHHTRKVLDALSDNDGAKESTLYIYCDGPKNDANIEERMKIKQVREVAKIENRFKDVYVVERVENMGLATSVITGVTEIVNKYGKIIVLEDDLVTSPYFLTYMNDALDIYESENEVICISGYSYPVKAKLPDTFFIKVAECWGWATWKKGWELFEMDGSKLLNEIEQSGKAFDFDFQNSYPYTQMLKDQIEGKNSSWAIRWYASAFLKNKYCLYSAISLVQNIGIDGSGTHSGTSEKWEVELAKKKIIVNKINAIEHIAARKAIVAYFNSVKNNKSFLFKAIRKVKSIIGINHRK